MRGCEGVSFPVNPTGRTTPTREEVSESICKFQERDPTDLITVEDLYSIYIKEEGEEFGDAS